MGKHEQGYFLLIPRSTKNPGWTIIHSNFDHYMDDFARVDPDRKITALLNRLLSVPEPVIVDLMASPLALESLVPFYESQRPKFFAVGIEPKDELRAVYGRRRKEVAYLQKDLNKEESLDEVEKQLEGRKAHMIMERAYGGLQYVPTELNFQRKTLKRLWNMLDPEGGLLVLQTPSRRFLEARGIPVKEWLEQLKEAGIYYQFVEEFTVTDGDIPYGMLLLEKNPSAVKLPDLMDRIQQPSGSLKSAA